MSSDPIEVLREVYWAGWLNASTWANRDDQLDDRGSEAYKKLEGEAVQSALASLSAPKPEGEWVELAQELQALIDGAKGRAFTVAERAGLMIRVAALNDAARMAPKAESAEAVAWVRPSALAAMNRCRNDDVNGCVDVWIRPDGEHTIPLYTAPPRPEASEEQVDHGTWEVFNGGFSVACADFKHDVMLHIDGDFVDGLSRYVYAEILCAKLNSAPQQASAPAGVEGLPRYGFPNGDEPRPVPCADGYWTPWHLAQQPAPVAPVGVEVWLRPVVTQGECVAKWGFCNPDEPGATPFYSNALAGQQQGGTQE